MEKLLVKIRALDDKRFELLRTCQFISDQTFQENGCINSYLAQDNDNENIINSQAAMDKTILSQ